MRESSRFLSKRYKFLRKLGTDPSISSALEERDNHINRVPSVKDVAILEPMSFPREVTADIGLKEVCIEQSRVHINRYDTSWPFRVEFVEQLLEVNCIWVVSADGGNASSIYQSSNGAISAQSPVRGITLDMVAIKKPTIYVADWDGGGPFSQRPLTTEGHLRRLEKERQHNVVIKGATPSQNIDAYKCNILPQLSSLYNCTFYNRDVAHLYLESLSEYIKRIASNTPQRF